MKTRIDGLHIHPVKANGFGDGETLKVDAALQQWNPCAGTVLRQSGEAAAMMKEALEQSWVLENQINNRMMSAFTREGRSTCTSITDLWHSDIFKTIDFVASNKVLFRDLYYDCRELIEDITKKDPTKGKAAKEEFDVLLSGWFNSWELTAKKSKALIENSRSTNEKSSQRLIKLFRDKLPQINDEIKIVSDGLRHLAKDDDLALKVKDIFVLPGIRRIDEFVLSKEKDSIICVSFSFRLDRGKRREMNEWLSEKLKTIYHDNGEICRISPALDCMTRKNLTAAKVNKEMISGRLLISMELICSRNRTIAIRALTSLLREAMTRYEENPLMQIRR